MSIRIEGLDDINDVIASAIKRTTENTEKTARESARAAEKAADAGFAFAEYPGTNDVRVSTSEKSKNGITQIDVNADGESVLFIEFGTGVRYTMREHPLAGEFGFTRGGYGKGQGANPKGWLYPAEKGEGNSDAEQSYRNSGMLHTYGNPAAMAMYNAGNLMEQEIDKGLEHLLK